MNKRVLTTFPYKGGFSSSYYSTQITDEHNTSSRDSKNDITSSSSSRDLVYIRDPDEISSIASSGNIYSELERMNRNSTTEGASQEILRLFPPPPKRHCSVDDRPVYKNGQCIPRKDSLLMEMILSDKATLKAQLDVTKHPIVGLDFVTEFIDPDGCLPRVYNCTLCKTFRTVATIMEHLTGYNHRVNYIQKQFPAEVKMFLLPDGRTKNRHKSLMIVASKRCSELELVYGRGDYEIKHEKPKMPEGALEAPESEVLIEGKQIEYLKSVLKELSKIKIENDEEARLAKSITTLLTNSVCEYKFSNAK